eukprot:CAMPEP_0201740038 /NCGR_PEP_ID=MMETSP0593-20130828/46094_1 /ASSEMBLY_ACC=CAM_ASM_000672 /TAXON_ID=267983 /ORGANISM="Skeletonema japonicum, Strain CCMP2506" /LENGTH=511 /DNA_ID=CAMNT_0048234339 /DNA_START=502 /DNA_END=2037 /DNA_ORIENTATION=-
MADRTDNNSNSSTDDAEKMRLAFEQFMLSGGKSNNNNNNSSNNSQVNKNNEEASSTPQSTSNKSKKKKKKKRQSKGATPTKAVTTSPIISTTKQQQQQQQQQQQPSKQSATSNPKIKKTTKQQQQQQQQQQQPSKQSATSNPKIKKRYYQLLRSFNDKVKHTWMDIDEQLLSVLQNIESIRGRVPHEWKVLSQLTRYHSANEEGVEDESPEQEEKVFNDNDNNDDGNDWKSHGHKRYYQLLRSFNDKVKHTWMDIDEQLLSVLQNIGSIRGRLPHQWKVLSQLTRCHPAADEEEEEGVEDERPEQEEKVFNDDNDDDGNDWKSHGHQETSKGSSQYYFTHHHLHLQDVQLAFSHDLEQHEKMLIGLRSLMSNLAECHDALGRIVDGLWQFHFDVMVVGDDDDDTTTKKEEEEGEELMVIDDDEGVLEYIVTCVTSSYQMLSMELYRKQNIVAVVIESTKDEILGMDELGSNKGHHGVGTKSQALVKDCCKSWKRSSSDEEALLNVMKLGEL